MGLFERKLREKNARREHILNSAKKVFIINGYTETTIEKISMEAELSTATIYIYFKNKMELYTELKVDFMNEINEGVEYIYEKKVPPIRKIELIIEYFIKLFKKDPFLFMNVIQLQASDDIQKISPELLEKIQESARRLHAVFKNICADGIREGCFININPVVLADMCWSIFAGMALWERSKSYFDKKKSYFESSIRIATKIYLRGICAARAD
jgi:AcrR family transcriptional regulator